MSLRSELDAVPRETALVVGLVSGSHVVNHLYLVLFPPILATLAADFGVGLAALGVAMGVQAFVNTALQLPYGYSLTTTTGLSPSVSVSDSAQSVPGFSRSRPPSKSFSSARPFSARA
jgi:hypothetical protein